MLGTIDIGAVLAAEVAFSPLTITGGDASDNVEQDGLAIDRFAIEQNSSADSRRRGIGAVLFISCIATLGHDETATLIANAQDADDSSFTVNAADFDHRASAQPPDITLPSLSLSVEGATYNVLKQQYDIQGARRYLRCQYTASLSDAAHTDTCVISGFWIFSGAQHNPFSSGLVGSWAAQQ